MSGKAAKDARGHGAGDDRGTGAGDGCVPDAAMLIKCPRCGLVSEGKRCERCNAPKILPCSGSCTVCGLSKCVAPAVKERGGL